MPYKELKRILYRDLEFDDNGNAIIKVPKGTTRVLLQEYEEPPLTNTQFKTIMNRFDTLESKIDTNTKSINANTESIKAVDAKVDANTQAIKSVQDDLNNIVEKNNLKR